MVLFLKLRKHAILMGNTTHQEQICHQIIYPQKDQRSLKYKKEGRMNVFMWSFLCDKE